jgi:hypothetical protein
MNDSIYLIATYYMKPQPRVNTSRAGWMKDPANIRWDEALTVTRGIKKRDNASGGIILNLTKRKVEKDSRQTNKDYGQLIRYFFMNYDRQLVPVLAQVDPEMLKEIAEELKAELDAKELANQPAVIDAEAVEVKDEAVQAS